MMRIPTILFCMAALPAAAAAAGDKIPLPTPVIDEWQVPWAHTRPRDPYVGPDGDVWFVGQRGDYVAALDPDSGGFRRIDLDGGTGPHNLIVAGDGTIYYAGNRAAHIGRIDPATGAIEKIPMPDDGARDPHTLVFDDAGRIFFTVQGGNRVGRLDPQSEDVVLTRIATDDARPYGIVVAPSGTVWATAFGSNRLLRIDPDSLAVDEILLPREDARPRRLQATTDGRIWYVDYAGGVLGFLHPESGIFKEYPTPGGPDSRPYGMAVDERNVLWFVESGLTPNRLVGFDPVTETFGDPVAVPSGGGTVRHMVHDPATDTIWFGTDTNTIGRATLTTPE